MQPTFPPDHHSHRRRGDEEGPVPAGERRINVPLEAERAAQYFMRQCLPAFDASDPREGK
ncbi:MAG TPA: hypothetical protein VEQ61_09760 [Thermoleophilaceae bacterium]|nr:hypothetical protein [Thermoleophilaceae bacterium]